MLYAYCISPYRIAAELTKLLDKEEFERFKAGVIEAKQTKLNTVIDVSTF
jgi:hypothetical protein